MLRVTKDNLRHENKTSQTIALLTSSTTCICTKIPQLMTRCPGEFGLKIFTNKRSDFKNRDVQNYFHTMFFHSVPSPSPIILKDKLILGIKKSQKFSSLKLWSTEESKNFNMVIFRFALWSSSIKLAERNPLTWYENRVKIEDPSLAINKCSEFLREKIRGNGRRWSP